MSEGLRELIEVKSEKAQMFSRHERLFEPEGNLLLRALDEISRLKKSKASLVEMHKQDIQGYKDKAYNILDEVLGKIDSMISKDKNNNGNPWKTWTDVRNEIEQIKEAQMNRQERIEDIIKSIAYTMTPTREGVREMKVIRDTEFDKLATTLAKEVVFRDEVEEVIEKYKKQIEAELNTNFSGLTVLNLCRLIESNIIK